MLQSYVDAFLPEVFLERRDWNFTEMENTCSQSSICLSLQESVAEMFFGSCSSGSDDRNGKSLCQMGECFVGISCFHAVVIHACEKYFAGSALVGFFSPFKKMTVGFKPSSIQVTFPSGGSLPGINGHYTDLGAEVSGDVVNQSRLSGQPS